MAELTLATMGKKKLKLVQCTRCGDPWQTNNRCYRICPACRKEKVEFQKQRARHKRNLPYYLKTDM